MYVCTSEGGERGRASQIYSVIGRIGFQRLMDVSLWVTGGHPDSHQCGLEQGESCDLPAEPLPGPETDSYCGSVPGR